MVLQNPCAHFTLYQGSPPRPHHDAFLHIFQVFVCIAPASARLFLTTLCKTSAPPARIVLLLVLFFLHGNENCLTYYMKMLVAPSYLILCNPMDCSSPGSSVHGILQARILEWVGISFSRGSSPPSDQTLVSVIEGRIYTICATREAP